MTRPNRFSQADLTRAIKGVEKAGLRVSGARIEPGGTIVVLTAANDETNGRPNPLDRLHHG